MEGDSRLRTAYLGNVGSVAKPNMGILWAKSLSDSYYLHILRTLYLGWLETVTSQTQGIGMDSIHMWSTWFDRSTSNLDSLGE